MEGGEEGRMSFLALLSYSHGLAVKESAVFDDSCKLPEIRRLR